MWKGTKLSNLRSTITNMELHNLKSGAPHVELCGYIIGFCVEISQTTSRLDRKQNWLHACAVGPVRPGFTKVGWASRWQIRESHFKCDDFLSRVTLKFDGWPWKTIGHLFYATSSFVQHFVAIGEFKLELQSGNAQSGSNSTFFRAVWPWNLTDDLQEQ